MYQPLGQSEFSNFQTQHELVTIFNSIIAYLKVPISIREHLCFYHLFLLNLPPFLFPQQVSRELELVHYLVVDHLAISLSAPTPRWMAISTV